MIYPIHGIKFPVNSNDMVIAHAKKNGGEFEPETIHIWKIVTAVLSGVVFDCGCYSGLFSAVAYKCNAENRVMAYDINPNNLDLFHEMRKTNFSCLMDSTFPQVCRKQGIHSHKTTLYADYKFAHSSAGKLNSSKSKELVETTTIDDEYTEEVGWDSQIPVTAIKIDTEGNEIAVLEGAEHVIDSFKPLIIAEGNTLQARIDLECKLRGLEYNRIWVADTRNVIAYNSDSMPFLLGHGK